MTAAPVSPGDGRSCAEKRARAARRSWSPSLALVTLATLSLATLPADRFVQQFGKLLDTEAGSLNPQDDLTLLVMEVAE